MNEARTNTANSRSIIGCSDERGAFTGYEILDKECGNYKYIYRVYAFYESGEAIPVSIRFPSYQQAERCLRELEREYAEGHAI